jgi:RNA polymerase sigma factor (sigma-70 family)
VPRAWEPWCHARGSRGAARVGAVACNLLCCVFMPAATETPSPRRRRRRSTRSLERRNEFVTRYYHCVEKVAKHLARRLPPSTDLGDLMSAGALGLLEAATRFDPSRGDSFEAFARIRIRGAMLDDIRLRDTMSRDMRRSWKAIGRSTTRLTQQLGRHPTEDELAGYIGLSLDALRARRAQLSGAPRRRGRRPARAPRRRERRGSAGGRGATRAARAARRAHRGAARADAAGPVAHLPGEPEPQGDRRRPRRHRVPRLSDPRRRDEAPARRARRGSTRQRGRVNAAPPR